LANDRACFSAASFKNLLRVIAETTQRGRMRHHNLRQMQGTKLLRAFLFYSGLFASAFLAATILPAQSEAGLAALLSMGELSIFWLITIASIGNILGAVVNWFLGRHLEKLKSRKWFPVNEIQITHATRWFQKFGVWSLLLSWVPLIGDPVTLAAGFFGVRLGLFLTLVSIAKIGRYIGATLLVLYLF
jgi:membrane protein YqaA with SNARE-associated domain